MIVDYDGALKSPLEGLVFGIILNVTEMLMRTVGRYYSRMDQM